MISRVQYVTVSPPVQAFRSIFPVSVPAGAAPALDKKSDSLKLRLLLSASQMVTENYPLPLKGTMEERFRDFQLTCPKGYTEVSDSSPLYSVDCEMCLTDQGNELTRICVVDSSLEVLYHKLVMPPNPIRNYLTR